MTLLGEYIFSLIVVVKSGLTYAGFTVVLFLVSKILWRLHILKKAKDPSSKYCDLPLPPGDFGIPFIGETLSWALQGSKFNFIRRKKHGQIFCTHFLGEVLVKVTGADNVRQILQSDHEKLTTIWPTTMRRIIGEHSLVCSQGDLHKNMKKLTMKGFTHSALNGYIPNARRTIFKHINSWETDECMAVKLHEKILRMSFETSLRAVAGIEFKTKKENEEAYQIFQNLIKNLMSMPYDLPFSGFRKGLNLKKKLHEILDTPIRRKIMRVSSNIEDDLYTGSDVIEHILRADMAEKRKRESKDSGIDSEKSSEEDEEHCYSVDEIKEQIGEMLFGGVTSTGSGISSFIIQLAKHPDVRKKVEMELEEHGILNQEEDDIDMEKLSKLKYLEQVIKETLRVMPPILGAYRRALKTIKIGNYRIPKDWAIVYNIQDTHQYEFGDEDDFNPDRFSREKWSEDRQNRFRWLPFGGGSRICPGKDLAKTFIKLTAIELFRAFRSWKFEGDKLPPMFALPVLHPTNGLPVIFTPRQ